MFKFTKRRRRRGPIHFKYVLLISLLIFTLITIQSLSLINNHINPKLVHIAELKTKQLASQAVSDTISSEISNKIDIKKLIINQENNKGSAYSFNPDIYNKLVAQTNKEVQKRLDDMGGNNLEGSNDKESEKDKGFVFYLPLGMITNNTLLDDLGPKVPVRFEVLNAVTTNIDTKVKETGINNTFLEVYLDIHVEMAVIIPSMSKKIELSNSVKVGDLFLQGEVPDMMLPNGFYNKK